MQLEKTKQVVDAKVDFTPQLDRLFQNIESLVHEGAENIFILSASGNNYDTEKLNNFLRKMKVPVSGAIFPHIIFNDVVSSYGSIVCGSNININVELIKDLDNPSLDYANIFSSIEKKIKKYKSMIVIVDSTCKHIDTFLETLYRYTSNEVSYLGGGAGSLSLKRIPCIYSNEGLLHSSALLLSLDFNSVVAVDHGWQRIAGPFIVTESENNILKMIDFKPALTCYKEIIEPIVGCEITLENFFEIAKNFPIGMEKLDGSLIVRDPVNVIEESSLLLMGDIIKNSLIYILRGDKDNLISAGKNVTNKLIELSKEKVDKRFPILVFDCVTRYLFLEEKFSEELFQFKDNKMFKNLNLIGATTIGEISSHGILSLEFFNKTLVAGIVVRN